jgi:hypothetical protein
LANHAIQFLAVVTLPSLLSIGCKTPSYSENSKRIRIQGVWDGASKHPTGSVNFIRPIEPGDRRPFSPTPGYEFEFISVGRGSFKSSCEVNCMSHMIVSRESGATGAVGEIFECTWVTEIQIQEPMRGYQIRHNGVLVIQQTVNNPSVLYEQTK